MGVDIPIHLSHRIAPVLGELRRLNAVVIQAYAAEPSREQFKMLEKRFKAVGYEGSVLVFTNYGTVVPTGYERLVHTVNSGPAGGATAVKYLSEVYGYDYVIGVDVGGTSFDVTAILAGQPVIRPLTMVGRFEVAVPSIQVESIGAGTGSYVRIDPVTKAVQIGPDSAGYRVGVCWKDGGVKTVTINDAMLILGYINPDYFLGGEVKLDKKRAEEAFEEQVASKLGVDVYDAAWGVYQMVSDHMRLHLESIVRGLGFSPENFYLVAYGGGGPLMVASVVSGLKFAGIMVPELAPAFSAYGASLSDIGFRAEKSVEAYVPPPPGVFPQGIAMDIMRGIADMLGLKLDEKSTDIFEGIRNMIYLNATNALDSAWKELKSYIEEEFKKSKVEGDIVWRAAVRMLYAGMLDDVEVESDSHEASQELIVELSNRFDELFEKVYASSAKSREFGYIITRAVLTGYIKLSKPELREQSEVGAEAPDEAVKGEREIYWGDWCEARVYEMGLLKSGNEISGPAIIEAPATTFVVPPGRIVKLDGRRVFWLKEVGE